MAEGYLLTRTAEAFLTEQLEERRRAERLEEVIRQVLHRMVHPEEVKLLVLDMGKGECLVALRHTRDLVQLRFWRELVDEVLAGPDSGIEQVLERIVAGALGLDPRGTVLQKAG
ncbi:MAG: hypothetical protein ACE5MG_13505 [Candidatus Methylomirabilales bacterium]